MFRQRSFLAPLLMTFVLTSCAAISSSDSPSILSSSQSSSQSSPSGQVFGGRLSDPVVDDTYGYVLNTYVKDGLVDYAALQANRQALDQFVSAVGAVPPDLYQSWSESEKIAFLINAYNAFTLQSIIDQQPLKASIRDIPGVWRIHQFKVVGQSKTLDNLEHQTLRKQFQEPRIHVALVCAAISCPPLRSQPYHGQELDAQLDDQVRRFLASPSGFRLDKSQQRVYLSSIFKWYGEDWQQRYGVESGFAGNASERAVLHFISTYLSPEDRTYLEQGNYQIAYLDYDWSLNKQR